MAAIKRVDAVFSKMAGPKTYLNVPFAQKDAAKALGAKWDAASKQWYVPAGKDCALFAQWHVQSGILETQAKTASKPIAAKTSGAGAITYPADKNFVAYKGDEPPWA